ncbi:MAG: Asp23/Gls24 family envelope stress response protein [Candidatus Omnitrophica bacterium]|nr:Asp23/Gls24 family envelope stress response protein [Candidatus Omnitrophota bacterium]
MDQNVKSELGTIRIHKKVISSITTNAAKEVDGVADLGYSLKSFVSKLFGLNLGGIIDVNIDNNNEVTISVPIIVSYGYNLPEVAAKVQENVRKMIEKSTELNIKQIDVNIQAVEKEAKK